MDSEIKDKLIINNFKDVLSIPTVFRSTITSVLNSDDDDTDDDGANQNNNKSCNIGVSIMISQTDIINKTNKIYQIDKTIIINNENDKIDLISSPFPNEIKLSHQSISPSFSKQLLVKDFIIEYQFDIIDKNHLITSIKSKDIHKRILNDEWFGGLSWSPCENYVAFIADCKINNKKDDEYLFKDNLGEGYLNVYNPSIFIFDLKRELVYPIDQFPIDKIIPGQIIWTKDSSGLVFVGWEIEKERLYGMKLCFNRSSSIYHLNFNQFINDKFNNNNNVTTKKSLILNNLLNIKGGFRFPRFTPDGNYLIFLGIDEIIYNHNSCSKIFKLKWNNNDEKEDVESKSEIEVLLDYKNSNDNDNEFYGIYNIGFTNDPFIDNDTIILTESIGSINKLVSFNIKSKIIEIIQTNGIIDEKELPLNFNVYSVNLKNRMILSSVSSCNKPTSIYLIFLNQNDNKIKRVKEIYKSPISNSNEVLKSFNYSIHKVPLQQDNKANNNSIKSIEFIYYKNISNNNQKKPTLLFIHGGPHMNITIEYSYSLAYIVSLGYNIISPNYRGSTGYGKDFVDSLPGKIGKIDVDDCLLSLKHAFENVDPNGIDMDRISLIGGSHGGFMAVHLATMKNYKFKTMVLRNPVIDVSSTVFETDIPDCAMFKCGIQPNKKTNKYQALPSLEEYKIMRDCSPNIQDVTIPVLILLGEKDKRVCWRSQGLVLYNDLLQRNIKTKCLMYPLNGHALIDTIDSKLDQWINIGKWLNSNC